MEPDCSRIQMVCVDPIFLSLGDLRTMIGKKNEPMYFPGAVPQAEFLACSSKSFEDHGFNRENTIVGVCVCREEPACFLVEDIRKLWGMVYDFSSLAGMPFAGKTGFMKMQKYAPNDRADNRFL